MECTEDPAYLCRQVITCIGNKRALLPAIGTAVEMVAARLGKQKLRILEPFSGSGIVARFLKRYADFLLVNDLEQYSCTANSCYLSNADQVPHKRLAQALAHVQGALANPRHGFISELYAPKDDADIQPGERVFYSRENAQILDTARQAINEVDADLRVFLLAPLLAQASVHANTAGVFKGFYKGRDGAGRFGGEGKHALSRILGRIEPSLPVFSRFSCECQVRQMDARSLTPTLHDLPAFDLAYLDPPYNQHPYGSNYFMLNLLASYQRPADISRVSGIPTSWNRSAFNKRQKSGAALFDLIAGIPAKFLLISYNSEGFIPHQDFLDFLHPLGSLTCLEIPYNTFRAGRNLAARPLHVVEFLYLLERS